MEREIIARWAKLKILAVWKGRKVKRRVSGRYCLITHNNCIWPLTINVTQNKAHYYNDLTFKHPKQNFVI